jgi:fructuronate reductase
VTAPERAPVRIVHLGLGAFHRAHQAWYTQHASDAADWGIAAFTGRSSRAADELRDQGCVYSLIERGPDHDSAEQISSIVEARPSSDLDRFTELVSASTTAVITMTVTEAGYSTQPDGALDRLLRGLDARRRANAGPIAVVPCDNMPGNGTVVRERVLALASAGAPESVDWIEREVSFVSTSVDRITPHTDGADVVTEPFSDWVLQGDFPSGRPDWGSAGARFVADIEPWEQRKLWLLNGAHSILTYAGIVRGHSTVSEAIADPDCRGLVEAFWAEAVHQLPPGVDHDSYRSALLTRFSNARIEHRLAQIAPEGSTKVRFRFAAIAERARAAGTPAPAIAAATATWITWLLTGRRADDAASQQVEAAVASPDPTAALITLISPLLAADPEFIASVRATVRVER